MFNETPSSHAKIVITGASGFLGAHLCRVFAKDYDVVAVSHRMALPEALAPYRVRLDLTDQPLVNAMLDNMRPIGVIHAAALSDPNTCEQNPDLSMALNVEVTRNLASSCAYRGLRFLFTSTDLVFDGQEGNYAESHKVNPINVYGEHKALAEDLIREIHPASIIARLPWMFGIGLTKSSALQHWVEQLSRQETLQAFNDEYRSAVTYSVAAEGLSHCFHHADGETLHLGGIETITRYHLLTQLAALLNQNTELVRAQSQSDVVMAARRPKDTSLDSRKARALGYKTPFLKDMLLQALSTLNENSHKA
ncbi:NAD(P)-dependent oxidoreductase [Hahella sp. CCB-MM4]|uniref:SDR family oxidoreductase n=1 Tax=Hahella sp. (strain CCB-MM4) TaxID=1926491 RepID=UPI000B9B6FD2|nr:NAD(P)-dependent oxidoreductase [Hahella sp. CCB-MM4]OZG74665.1 NAD(P)-dependent oxidoreductase [Hahella sp. CCB-MM4]